MLGKKLRDRYQITKELGSGGFGDTYLAQDQGLPGHPLCVVKHLRPKHPDPAVFPIARQLFDQEAEILYKLGKHEQIPQLIEHIQDSGDFYLVQEFVDGADLTEEIIPGKPCSEAKTLKLIREILEVLRFVHQEKIIHRDLKPDNLMRRKSDQKIVVIDFGAVKQIGTMVYNQQQRKTYFSAVVGTEGYMPHEQAGGNPQLASDVYAVGMLAIQALTGYHPADLEKDDETLEVLWRQKAPGVSKEFAQVIDKMVTNYFPYRYKNASEALNALNQISAPNNNPVPKTVGEPINYQPTINNPPPQPLYPTTYPPPQPTQIPKTAPNTMSRNQFIQLALYTTGGMIASGVIASVLKQPQPQPTVTSTPVSPQPQPTATPTPVSPQPTPSNSLGLKTFSFETVKVNSSGAIIKKENKSAEYFTVDLGNGVTMDFVAIPGESFMMGSPSTEKERDDDEGPQRLVTLKPFFMGKYPVTQAQYEAIMGNNPAYYKGANRPVENVSWDDSVNFCNKLSEKIGKECTLATEAQWEYACRAGTTTPFYFGETITSDLANYKSSYTYANEPIGLGRQDSTEVGIFPPNAFGLYDLHGNVLEWCLDGYGSYQNGKQNGSSINNSNNTKILRGGSFHSEPKLCRSANRGIYSRDVSCDCAGFRAVCLVGRA